MTLKVDSQSQLSGSFCCQVLGNADRSERNNFRNFLAAFTESWLATVSEGEIHVASPAANVKSRERVILVYGAGVALELRDGASYLIVSITRVTPKLTAANEQVVAADLAARALVQID